MATRRRTPARKSTCAAVPRPFAAERPVGPVAGGRAFDRRDRPPCARCRHPHRPRPSRPGAPDRLVARLDRALLRGRPIDPAICAPGGGLVRRMGSRQGGEGAVGADPHRHDRGVRRLPRGHPAPRVLGARARYRGSDRPRAGIRPRPARDQPRCLHHRARDVRGGPAGHVRHDPSDRSRAGGESGHRVPGVTPLHGRRQDPARGVP